MGMEKLLADEILRLKRLLAEQESLNRVLHARLEEREREIERLLLAVEEVEATGRSLELFLLVGLHEGLHFHFDYHLMFLRMR